MLGLQQFISIMEGLLSDHGPKSKHLRIKGLSQTDGCILRALTEVELAEYLWLDYPTRVQKRMKSLENAK